MSEKCPKADLRRTSAIDDANRTLLEFGHPWTRTVSEPYLYLSVPPLNLAVGSADTSLAGEGGFPMKRLMTSAVAAVALLAAGANILWPRSASPEHHATTLGMPPLQALADVNKFPHDEFEDQSLVFAAAARH